MYQVKFLTFIMLVHMERLNLIVISCGESFVTTNEWACTVSQAHTRAMVFILAFMKKSATEIGNII